MDTSYKILGLSSMICTIHLAWDTEDSFSLNVRDQIILHNLNFSLFTLLNTRGKGPLNDTFQPHTQISPAISFFEECSVQILVESPDITNWEKYYWFHYFLLTRYPLAVGGIHNILILVRFDLDTSFPERAGNLPVELFIHFVNTRPTEDEKQKPSDVFPNTLVCRQCKQKYHILGPNSTVFGRMELSGLKHRGDFTRLNLFVVNMNSFHDEVSEDILNSTEKKFEFRKEIPLWTHKLSLRSIISNNLILHDSLLTNIFISLNITPVKVLRTVSYEMEQYLHYMSFNESDGFMEINSIETYDYRGTVILESHMLSWIYCDFNDTETVKSTFKAWWSPFSVNVWILVFLTVILTSTTLYFTVKQIKIKFALSDFLFISLRGVLRQDGVIRNELLVLCSCIALIYTSLYENTITSELIAPVKPRIVESLYELIELGYKVIINVADPAIDDYYNDFDESHYSLSKYSAADYIMKRRAVAFKSEVGDYNAAVANSSVRYGSVCAESHSYCQSTARYISVLSKNHSCFLTRKKNDFHFDLILSLTYFDYDVFKISNRFKSFGLTSLWRRLAHVVLQNASTHEERTIGNDNAVIKRFISLRNLRPVFALWGVLLCVTSVVYIKFETYTKETGEKYGTGYFMNYIFNLF